MPPMIESPFKNVHFDWLSESGSKVESFLPTDFCESGWIAYPMPSETGSGGYELLDLALGTSVVRTSIAFTPSMLGKWVPLMDVNAEFTEPSFQAMTLRGLRGNVQERFPPAQIAISEGIDLFRHTPHYASSFTADASYSGDGFHLSIARSTMNRLIGDTVAKALLTQLNLTQVPGVAAHSVPLHVSQHIVNATAPALTGSTRKLYCQAKVLEYLAALVHHMCANTKPAPERNQKSKQRIRAIHDQLVNCEGKLPTLDELSAQYGCSARLLNEEFALEFGQSIYNFVMSHRLTQAHAALQQTDISIKQLAAKLGYAHVSNFTIAFKRRFSYSPGSLRRKPI